MRALHLLVFSFMLGLALMACEDRLERSELEPVEDELGRTIEIRPPVRRLISLAPSATEIAFAAGAGHLFVGANVSDDFPPAVNDLPRFNTYPIDVEAVVSLDPDLALASDQVNHPAQVVPLETIGVPTYFLASRSLWQIPDAVRALGELLGTAESAALAADSLRASLERLRAMTDTLQHRPTVLVLAGLDPLYSFGSGSYVHELIALAGGTSLTAEFPTAAPVLSEEYVLRRAPEVIVGADAESLSARLLLQRYPTWDLVPAVRDARVYPVDPDLLFRPGPRLIQAAYHLASTLHPELHPADVR